MTLPIPVPGPHARAVFWHLLTRLGEAQILLPAAALVLAWMAWRLRPWTTPLRWVGAVGVSATITTASKVAFIGFGLGIASLNFTGFSGHAMFSAAVMPLMALALLGGRSRRLTPAVAVGAGYALALAVAVSRVMVHAHSWSEVVAGFALGAAASAVALAPAAARERLQGLPAWMPAVLAAWLVLLPLHAPPSHTHDQVTRLALALAGHDRPYRRADLVPAGRLRPARPAPVQPPHASTPPWIRPMAAQSPAPTR